MKAALFLLSLWFCFFVVTDAIDCLINGTDTTLIKSDCVACGYHSVVSSSDHQCEAKVERMCLPEILFEYIDSAGNKRIFNQTECAIVTPHCRHMLYICLTDKCNMACGPTTPSSSSPSLPTHSTPATSNTSSPTPTPTGPTTTPTTTTTTTTPSPTTTITSNLGNLEGTSLSVFGLISLIFAFIH